MADPFSASRRNRKVNVEESLKELDDNLKKSLSYDEDLTEIAISSEKTLDSSKENADEPLELKDKKTSKETAAKPLEKKGKKTSKEKTDKVEIEESSASSKYDKESFKNPANEKDWNFKIATWNVNGVRAWLEVSFLFL